jgi:ATP-dependent Clp protease ATP-binding subunit ClpA
VEASFGPGALDHPPHRPTQRQWLWPRGRCAPADTTGHLSFTPPAKRALERAQREATALADKHIGAEHLLLGLLDPAGNMAVDVLQHLSTKPDDLRTRVLDNLGRAA